MKSKSVYGRFPMLDLSGILEWFPTNNHDAHIDLDDD